MIDPIAAFALTCTALSCLCGYTLYAANLEDRQRQLRRARVGQDAAGAHRGLYPNDREA